MSEDDHRNGETGKREYPAGIDETAKRHPPEDWTGMYDGEDPNAGKRPYPDSTDGDGE